jgi:hypothetical protein
VQLERLDVARADDGEVPAVECADVGLVEPLGQRDDRRVGAAERQIGVLLDELGGASQVLLRWNLDLEPGDRSDRRKRASAVGPPARSIMNVASAITSAGTMIGPGAPVMRVRRAS